MTELLFVGTSDAFGSGGRRQSAILVRAPQGSVLVDCGPTTGTGLAALDVDRNEIDAILLSHFHSDHFGGVPQFLIASLYQDRRRHPIRIAGPPDVERRVRGAAAALGHPIEATRWPFPIEFQELRPGVEAETGPVRATSFETYHQPDSHPQGHRIRAGPHRIVYSGDTGWFDDLPRRASGSHLFICECTLLEQTFEYHLSYEELSGRRDEFDCDRMILTHLGREMCERRGRTAIETADDGLSIKL